MIACDKRPMNITCKQCGAEYNIMVSPDDVLKWQAGHFIQDVLSYLSAAERELMISQTCDNCWKSMWGDDE